VRQLILSAVIHIFQMLCKKLNAYFSCPRNLIATEKFVLWTVTNLTFKQHFCCWPVQSNITALSPHSAFMYVFTDTIFHCFALCMDKVVIIPTIGFDRSYQPARFGFRFCPYSSYFRDNSQLSCKKRKYVNSRIKIQLDATCYFIVLLIGPTCFGYYYAHRKELATMLLITTLVVSFLVCCVLEVRCG